MWHMFASFTQQPSVNWYTEQGIRVWYDYVCVCVCSRAWGRGCLMRASVSSYLPPRNTCTGAQIRGMSPGFGAPVDVQTHSKQSAARKRAAAAAARGAPGWCLVEWRATQPSPLSSSFSPRSYTPLSNFNQSPCPFQLPPAPPLDLFSPRQPIV